MLAIRAAREAVPDLQIVQRPLHGRAWRVDHCCNTVHIAAELTPDRYARALIAALAALVATVEPGMPAVAIPAPRTRLVNAATW